MKRKKKKIDLNNLKPNELFKYEVAKELGLLPKILEHGWESLSSRETGKIGGLVNKKKSSKPH